MIYAASCVVVRRAYKRSDQNESNCKKLEIIILFYFTVR